MPPHPAQTTGTQTQGGVYGPGWGAQTPFGPNDWSPQNPALGQYNELYNKNVGMGAYDQAANTPLASDPLVAQAMKGLTANSQLGQQGAQALGGNENAMQGFMNPYNQNVLQQMMQQWTQQNQGLSSQLGNQAAGQNAFGGSRAAIAEGQGLSQNLQNQAMQAAQLQQQGLYNAQNLAQNAAQMGQGADTSLNQMGVQQANWKPSELAMGFNSYPQQTVSTGQGTQQPSTPSGFQQILGAIGSMGPALLAGK